MKKIVVPFIPLGIGVLLVFLPQRLNLDDLIQLRIHYFGLILLIGSFLISFVSFVWPKQKREWVDFIIIILSLLLISISAPMVIS